MKIVKLSEICTFSRGLTYSKSDEVDFSSNVVLRANNIDLDSNSLNLEDLRYIKDSIKIKEEKIAKKNSLIICTASGSKTHVGKVALIDEDYGYAFGGFMGQLTPTDKCHHKFLYYVLTSGLFKDFLMCLNDGTNINNLKFSDIENYEVPLPTLEKQREIVAKLETAFAEIEEAKIKTSLTVRNLSRLLDSKFEEVLKLMEVEYGMIQSGTVIDVRDGTHDSPSYVDSGYPLVTSKNLQDGLIDFSKVSLIKEDDYQKINKRSKVEVGDLLFAMIGTIGNPVVVKEEPLFAIKNVALFKGNPKYDMNFLSYYLRSPRIKEKFDREAKGTTQRFLGLGYLRTFEIPNVPIDKQFEIVRKLEQFESELKKLEHNLKQRLESLIELNNSILSSFFTSDSEKGAVA